MTDKRLLVGLWLGLTVLGMVVGCSSGQQVREGIPTLYPEDYQFGTNFIGSLGVNEQKIIGVNPTHDTLVNASFIDVSNYKVFLADRHEYPPSCFIYAGLPWTEGAKANLNVTGVTVSGLIDGDHSLSSNGTSFILDLENRAFGAEPVSFAVESGSGPSDFPSFGDQINAPVFPKLLRLGSLNSPDLSSGPSLGIAVDRADPLVVAWERSTADYFEILLIPNAGSTTPYAKLRCIAYDDGYLEVPPDAINELALDTCTNWRFRIERHNFKLHTIKDGETTKAVAVIDVSSVLEAIVTK